MKTVQFPIEELWVANGLVSNTRGNDLGREDIVRMLQLSKIRFVIAVVGLSLEWLDTDTCCSMWKTDIKSHLIELQDFQDGLRMETLDDGYGFTASGWQAEGLPIVLLHKWH